MARQRLVKPDVFQHEELHRAEMGSGLPIIRAFIGLWTQADRRGLFEWKPGKLKANICPFDSILFDDVLSVLEHEGFIRSYVVDGKRYGCIPTMPIHQSFNVHEKPNKLLPLPPDTEASTVLAPLPHGVIPPGISTGSSASSSTGSSSSSVATGDEPELTADERVARGTVYLTITANSGITARYGEQPSPILASDGKSHALARDVHTAGITFDFAARSVARQVLVISKPVRSLNYFRPGIFEDWAKHNERVAATGATPVQPLERMKRGGDASLIGALLRPTGTEP